MEPKLMTKTLLVKGMTCVNCENRIETRLEKINGIISVTASYSGSQVKFIFDEDMVKLATIVKSIEELDYKVVKQGQQNKDKAIEKKTKITQVLGIVFIIFAAYFIINHFGGFNIFNSFPVAKQGLGYGALFFNWVTHIHSLRGHVWWD